MTIEKRRKMEEDLYNLFVELHGHSVIDDREYEWEHERLSTLSNIELEAEWTEYNEE